ncbi:MAG: RDD family protein [Dehalococcoidia bacterium]|nr:RDD family protein [Dehalococcoidia bacterium]
MAPPARAATAVGGQPASRAYAGLQLRIVAFILDVMVLISFGMLFAATAGAYLIVDSSFNDGNLSDRAPYVAVAIFLVYVFLFVPLYHVLLWSWHGQTVGMMAVHVKVLSQNGGRVTRRRAAVRFFGRIASVLPLFLGLLMALFDRKHRTLHDRLAGTVVVEQP